MCKQKLMPAALAATLMACAATAVTPSTTVSAMYRDEKGNEWWSAEELLEYSKEVDAEEKSLCGDDFSCREELFFSKLEAEDKKYESLDMFRQEQFQIASINPATEQIKALYFDQDPMLRRMGIEEKDSLRHIYMAWSVKGDSNIGNVNIDLPLESQIDMNDVRIMYFGDATQFGEGGFPSNQIFDLPVESTNLAANTSGKMIVVTHGYNFYNAYTGVDYRSCLQSPGYVNGDSCDFMFSAGQGTRYFPHSLVTRASTSDQDNTSSDPTDESADKTAPTKDLESGPKTSEVTSSDSVSPELGQDTTKTSELAKSSSTTKTSQSSSSTVAYSSISSDDGNTVTTATSSSNSTSDGTSNSSSSTSQDDSKKSESMAAAPMAESVELPMTGEVDDKCEQAVAFPWWLVLLLLLGDAVALWIFWPKNRKKVEKNS